MEVQKDQTYRHYKNGKTYKILAVGRNEKTLENVVVYQALYDDVEFGKNAVWVRPYEVFIEKVMYEGILVPRFTLIG